MSVRITKTRDGCKLFLMAGKCIIGWIFMGMGGEGNVPSGIVRREESSGARSGTFAEEPRRADTTLR